MYIDTKEPNMAEKRQDTITIYCLLKEECLIQRIKELNQDKFKIVIADTVDEATVCNGENCVIMVEKDIFPELKVKLDPEHTSVIIVSHEHLDLSDALINKVPKELFLTKYLDEFVFWVVEKARYLKLLQDKKQVRKEKIQTLINELNDINKQPVLDKIESRG